MKQRYFAISVVLLAGIFALTFIFTRPTAATQTETQGSINLIYNDQSAKTTDYLVTLPIAHLEPDDIPPDLEPDQAVEYARDLVYQQAQPLLNELKRLRAEGHITGYQVQPELNGVVITGLTENANEELLRLQGVESVMPFAQEPPVCAVATAKALSRQVLRLSHANSQIASQRLLVNTFPQATDPSIRVEFPFYEGGYVYGYTTESTTVALRVIRGGQVISSLSTTSSSSGYYYFESSWHSCPTPGYDWTLQPGDVVEVTAHGNTVSTVVAYLRGWVDPVVNTVAGKTDPGRSVDINLYNYPDPCSSSGGFYQTVLPDAGGNFYADFNAMVDFNRLAYAYIYARDSNDNYTYYWFYAYRINGYFNDNYSYGYLAPEADFTATLSRGGNVISTFTGKSDPDNDYYSYFTDTVKAEDIINVYSAGISIQTTVPGLDVAINPTTNWVSGATSANRTIRVRSYKRDYGNVTTTCSYDSNTVCTTTDGTGTFSLDTGLDLVRGDYVYFYVYDAEGNYFYGLRSVPAIIADLTYDEAAGYWGNPVTDYLTVTLKTSGGVIKEVDDEVWVDSWDGDFDTWFSLPINATDIIEVTDKLVTETMTVQNLTSRLNSSSDTLTGNAGNGQLLAELWDYLPSSSEWDYYCGETAVSTGVYDLTFAGSQIGGQDYADVWNAGSDGHYTYRDAYAFTVNVEKEGTYVSGESETPFTPIDVTLYRSGTPISVFTTTASSSGYFEGVLGGGEKISQGDNVLVHTGDGINATVPVPELTLNLDRANNLIYGRSPANQPIETELVKYGRWGWDDSLYLEAIADSLGNYRADYSGRYWDDCSEVDFGSPCIQPILNYFNEAGYRIWMEGPEPQIGADIYESDDTSGTAKPYLGLQSHSFHSITDTDWISFTVSSQDVADQIPFLIATYNVGEGMATYLALYDTNGTTLLAYKYGYGSGAEIIWTPTSTGTYFVQVSPPSQSYTTYCDAVYDLLIVRNPKVIFMPLTVRNR